MNSGTKVNNEGTLRFEGFAIDADTKFENDQTRRKCENVEVVAFCSHPACSLDKPLDKQAFKITDVGTRHATPPYTEEATVAYRRLRGRPG